jgi:hypothetical protein
MTACPDRWSVRWNVRGQTGGDHRVAVHLDRWIVDRLNEQLPSGHESFCRDRAATCGWLRHRTGLGVRDLRHDRASVTWIGLLDLPVGRYEWPDPRLEAGARNLSGDPKSWA